VISIFGKPLREIGVDDLSQLIDGHVAEGYNLEFKKALPDKKGDQRPSANGQVGDYARDKILGEIVAFANSQGGYLVLGIDETDEKPPRAKAITPLPAIGEIARRLEDQSRSCIDLPLRELVMHPIQTGDDGAGVLILFTGPSRMAPHRLSTTGDCYVRNGSSTVPMNMREIQDMTLNVARGLAAVDAKFQERCELFGAWIAQRSSSIGVRVTAIPVENIPNAGRLFGRRDFCLWYEQLNLLVSNRRIQIGSGAFPSNERPIVRGLLRYMESEIDDLRVEQYQDGMIDVRYRFPAHHPMKDDKRPTWYHSWTLSIAANTLLLIAKFRDAVGVYGAEFGFEVEILTNITPVIYHGLFAQSALDSYELRDSQLLLPRLSVGARDTFDEVLNVINTDIYDGLGSRHAPISLSLDWPPPG
jgi:hypothetical protein